MALELLVMLDECTKVGFFGGQCELLDEHLIGTLLQLDRTTLQHSMRTSKLAVLLGKKLGLDGAELELLGQGALLHDIGKIRVPSEILNKEDPLNSEEWSLLQTHPQRGCEHLVKSNVDEVIRRIVLNHHVWFNGEGGYPLAEDRKSPCPLTQIVMVADVVDAMTSDRPYRKAHSIEATREYIEDRVGSWFNGEVVGAFGRLVFKIEEKGW